MSTKALSEVRLRGAEREDFAAISSLLRASGLPAEDLDERKLESFIVALGAEGLAGVVGLEAYGADGLLRSLVVGDAHRGEGLGGRLLRAIEAEAAGRGVKRLFLLTTTAAPYFARAGYLPGDRRAVPAAIAATSEFATLCPDSAVCLERSL